MIAGTETWRRASELATALGGWTPFAGALSLTPRGRELLDELGAAPPVLGERQASEPADSCADLARLLLPRAPAWSPSESGVPAQEARAFARVHAVCAIRLARSGTVRPDDRVSLPAFLARALGHAGVSYMASGAAPRESKRLECLGARP